MKILGKSMAVVNAETNKNDDEKVENKKSINFEVWMGNEFKVGLLYWI